MTNELLRDEVLMAADVAARAAASERMRQEFIWYRDIRPSLSINYVVRGLIQQGTLALVFGEPGTGKSFFALDLALCVASGLEWRSRKVRQGVVLYFAAEAGGSVMRRVEAWRRRNDVADADFAIRILPLDLLEQRSTADLLALCDEVRRVMGPIRMIVVDTVSRSMPGGDENAAETMTQYVAHCDRLRVDLDATIILVHHRGKDATRGARGHSSLKAAVDTEIEISRGLAKVTKQRDEPSGLEFPFSLLQVEIGVDDEGVPQTSCVVVAETETTSSSAPASLTSRQRAVFDTVRQLIDEAGQDIEEGPLAAKRVVAFADAVARVASIINLTKPHRRRAEARRVLEALAKHGCLAVAEGSLWVG